MRLRSPLTSLSFIFAFLYLPLFGGIEDHFKPCENKSLSPSESIEGIDYIYLINLDKRSDRLKESLNQLKRYSITPYRFSAIQGSSLSYETLSDIAVPYENSMKVEQWAHEVTPDIEQKDDFDYIFLTRYTPNSSIILSQWTKKGAIGCALSHLSILKDAYESGYETIWVLEDDLKIQSNPLVISTLIKQLDDLTDGNWDVLYTDSTGIEINTEDPKELWWMWRPEEHLSEGKNFAFRKPISKEFIAVGSHTRTHSMIIRRSGMEKILNHVKDNHLYLPIDHEIAFAPDINLYVTSQSLVTYRDTPSDIQLETNVPLIFENNS